MPVTIVVMPMLHGKSTLARTTVNVFDIDDARSRATPSLIVRLDTLRESARISGNWRPYNELWYALVASWIRLHVITRAVISDTPTIIATHSAPEWDYGSWASLKPLISRVLYVEPLPEEEVRARAELRNPGDAAVLDLALQNLASHKAAIARARAPVIRITVQNAAIASPISTSHSGA